MYHVYLPISTFLSLKVNYVFILCMKEQVPPLYFCPGAQRELDSNQFAAQHIQCRHQTCTDESKYLMGKCYGDSRFFSSGRGRS